MKLNILKKYHVLYLILFLISLPYIIALKEYSYQGDKEANFYIENLNNSEDIDINFTSTHKSKYTKIYISEIKSDSNNYIISVFSDEKRTQRIQMDQSILGIPKLWLTKNQTNHEKIYLNIKCDKLPCNYTLNIKPEEIIELNISEQMSYYVSENNLEMLFLFNLPPSGINDYMNIWAKGEFKVNTELSMKNNVTQYVKNNYYLFKPSKNSELTLKVKAQKGDFINVGSQIYEKNIAKETFVVDDKPETIFLLKNILEKACFKMKLDGEYEDNEVIYINGNVDSNVVMANFIDNNENEVNDSKIVINDGLISISLTARKINSQKICFGFPSEEPYSNVNDIILTFQLSSGKTVAEALNIYEPQRNGYLYIRYLRKGQKAAFIGHSLDPNYKEINFNMISIIGNPKMTVEECDDYPLCLKSIKSKNSITPHNVNKFTTYSVYKDELIGVYSPISLTQNLFAVECVDSEKKEDSNNNDICIFGTLIYSNINPIILYENYYYNQYLLFNESDIFKIIYLGQNNIKKIYVDINVFSGQVLTNLNQLDGHYYQEYYNANKISFVINLNNSVPLKEITFAVNATKNSFYSIHYSLARYSDNEFNKTENLESGILYLITINPKKDTQISKSNKIISFQNILQFEKYPFLVNFYSLNCKLEINARRKGTLENKDYLYFEKIKTFDYFTQDLYSVKKDEKTYNLPQYDYYITVDEENYSNYNNKQCMLYASAIELTDKEDKLKKEIVIGENIEQQIMFKKDFDHISYLYPNVEYDNDFYIRFNIIDKAKYTIQIFYEYEKGENYTLVNNKIILINHENWKKGCPEKNEVCNIIININLEERVTESEPMLEFEINTIKSVSYLKKNYLKSDFIFENNPRYYYAEIDRNEQGSVTVNFKRGSGEIYMKLVKANKKIEGSANWKNITNFLKNSDESHFIYDSFSKKMDFFIGDDDDCYLLITIITDTKNSKNLIRYFPFSISLHSSLITSSYELIPSIDILPEEYIIGNIRISIYEKMNEFYNVWINRDADKIVIDFQSNEVGLFINLGDEQPSTKNADFKFFPKGKGSLLIINKNEIIEKAKNKANIFPTNITSLKDITLTIGLWTNVSDTVDTIVYAFLVHLKKTDIDFDIYKVDSDQKTLCKTTNSSDDENYSYRCLYIINAENYSPFTELLVYANLQNESIPYQIYADYLEIEDYELDRYNEIKKNIPNKNSTFSTDKTKLDYIYLNESLNNKYLFVSVVTKENTIIELMSSFNFDDEEITPNPSTPQLFILNKEKIKLNLINDQNYLSVNLISLNGEAEIFWSNETNKNYYLKDRDDRLSISSLKDNSKLIIRNVNSKNDNEKNETSFFVFYLSYTIKQNQNFDEIQFGKSVHFAYAHCEFPLNIYSKLENYDKNINIFFNFYDIVTETDNKNINENKINIRAAIIKQNTLYDLKKNPQTTIDQSDMIDGIYDPGLKAGFIRLTKEDLKSFNVLESENPNLYITITENEKKNIYGKISLEITVIRENSLISTTENVYQYGSLFKNETNVYKLRPNFIKPKMRLEFSSTDDNIKFVISKSSLDKTKDIIKNDIEKNYNGKKLIYISTDPENNEYLYLHIYREGDEAKQEGNFVFKYINYDKSSEIEDYYISNSEISVSEKNNKYFLEFNPIPNSTLLNAIYSVKFVKSNNNNLPKETIAISSEINCIVEEFTNPEIKKGRIKLEIQKNQNGTNYIAVYALIHDKNNNEYIPYKIYKLKEKEDIKLIIILIIVGSILLVAVGIMIFVSCKLYKKNKNLVNKVIKISFQIDEADNCSSDNELLK